MSVNHTHVGPAKIWIQVHCCCSGSISADRRGGDSIELTSLAEAQNTNKGRSKHDMQQLLNAKTRKYWPRTSIKRARLIHQRKPNAKSSLKANKLTVKLRATNKHLDIFWTFFCSIMLLVIIKLVIITFLSVYFLFVLVLDVCRTRYNPLNDCSIELPLISASWIFYFPPQWAAAVSERLYGSSLVPILYHKSQSPFHGTTLAKLVALASA